MTSLTQHVYLFGEHTKNSGKTVVYARDIDKVTRPISSLLGIFTSQFDISCDVRYPVNKRGQIILEAVDGRESFAKYHGGRFVYFQETF